MLISFLLACGQPMSEEQVRAAVLDEFTKKNPAAAGGEVGWEIVGKGTWYRASEFDSLCLADNDLAFQNHKKSGYISPTYASQELITVSTKRGYCVDLGKDLKLEIVAVEPVSESSSAYDVQRVKVRYTVTDPSPFFKLYVRRINHAR